MALHITRHPRLARKSALAVTRRKSLSTRISERRRPATATFKALARQRRVR